MPVLLCVAQVDVVCELVYSGGTVPQHQQQADSRSQGLSVCVCRQCPAPIFFIDRVQMLSGLIVLPDGCGKCTCMRAVHDSTKTHLCVQNRKPAPPQGRAAKQPAGNARTLSQFSSPPPDAEADAADNDSGLQGMVQHRLAGTSFPCPQSTCLQPLLKVHC